jgi:hypothetical protein
VRGRQPRFCRIGRNTRALSRLLEVGGRHSRSPTISRSNKEELNEDAHESTCNRSAGGRRHDRKCPVRKPHIPIRTNGRGQQCVQRHPRRAGNGNTADRNDRSGHDDKKERCQGAAQEVSALGVRKPQPALRTGGRRRPTAGALNFCFELAKSRRGRRPALGCECILLSGTTRRLWKRRAGTWPPAPG